jgi:uncharacterized protein
MLRFAYYHGYASSPKSRKGLHLANILKEQNLELQRPDLNRPSLSEQSYQAIFNHLDKVDAELCPNGEKWCIVGSSMGGYIASRWAQLRPDRVEKLLLLCPGFDMRRRWPALLGEGVMAHWKNTGWLERADGEGKPTKIHYKIVEEMETMPSYPEVHCPVHVIHGRGDETVPFSHSEHYCGLVPGSTLIPVEDDHSLMKSLSTIEDEVLEFLGARAAGSKNS